MQKDGEDLEGKRVHLPNPPKIFLATFSLQREFLDWCLHQRTNRPRRKFRVEVVDLLVDLDDQRVTRMFGGEGEIGHASYEFRKTEPVVVPSYM